MSPIRTSHARFVPLALLVAVALVLAAAAGAGAQDRAAVKEAVPPAAWDAWDAGLTDLRSPDARAAAPALDLRSPDARDAAEPARAALPADGGFPWLVVAGATVLTAALATGAATGRRRRRRAGAVLVAAR